MNRRDAMVASAVSVGLAALLVPIARMGADFHHDGIMLKPALDVLSGQSLFRETFTQYGALTTYLQVVALWIQPSLLALKLQTVAAYAVTLFFLYASWRQILPRSLTVFSCGLFTLFIPLYEQNTSGEYWMLLPWSSVFAMMFQSIGLFSMFRIIRGEQPARWGLVLGLVCACAFWCRQPVGLLMFGSIVAIGLGLHWTNWTLAGQSKRSILVSIAAGFVAVNALLLGSILISGALSEWWYQNFTWPRTWALRETNLNSAVLFYLLVHPAAGAGILALLLAAALPALAKKFHPNLTSRSLTVYYLGLGVVLFWQHERMLPMLALRAGGWSAFFPFVVVLQLLTSVALAATSRGKPKTTDYYLISALTVFSLGSLPQYLPIPDPYHVVWSLAPTFGLFAVVYWRWVGWSAPMVAVALTGLFLPALWEKIQSGRQAMARPMVALQDPPFLRGMKVPPEQAHTIGRISRCVEDIVHHRPDIPSAMIGNDAMFLCFTPNRENPSPYFVTWTGLADNQTNRLRWSRIISVRPILFLQAAKWDAVNDFYRRSNYVPLLYSTKEVLEIAVPQELADTMGLSTYDASLRDGATRETLKP